MLHQKIVDDLKGAMKAGQEFEVGVFRFLLASLHNKEIEKKGKGLESTLSDDEAIEVLSREAKKRKEAIEAYEKGNRTDLAQKETKELEIIEKYLPEQLSEEEIEKIITAAIKKTGAVTVKDFGKVMGVCMKKLSGKADGSSVNKIVKEEMSKR